jgi:hypothetical protein
MLRRAARQGDAGAKKILANPDALDFYLGGLPSQMGVDLPELTAEQTVELAPDPTPTPVPPVPVPPNHPILDLIQKLFAQILANPAQFIAFIQMILKLFGIG